MSILSISLKFVTRVKCKYGCGVLLNNFGLNPYSYAAQKRRMLLSW